MDTDRTCLGGIVSASPFGGLLAVGAYLILPLPQPAIMLQPLLLGLAGTPLWDRLGGKLL